MNDPRHQPTVDMINQEIKDQAARLTWGENLHGYVSGLAWNSARDIVPRLLELGWTPPKTEAS